jgi:hypothetical protein
MKVLFSAVVLFLVADSTQGAINQVISAGTNRTTGTRPAFPSGLSFLSQEQMVLGLREALNKGVQQAVLELGHDGGFLTNLHVRIPMPEKLAATERTLRSLGQDKLADDFVAAMNHAAEQAVPQATAVFVDAVQRMTVSDAQGILTGPDDAATRYFHRVTQTNLYQRFLPIVKTATDQAGVTSTYKRLLQAMNQNQYLGILSSIFLNPETVDIDAYVTERALDGLFKMVAREEARIRRDPVARTSELLQRVFGAIYSRY